MEDIDYGSIFGGIAERSAKRFEEDRIREKNIAEKGNFTRGLESGLDQTQGSLYGGVGLLGDALDLESVRDWGFEGYQRNMEEASLNPVDVQNFTDIETDEGVLEAVSDTGKWFAGTLGQLAPSMATALASSVAGAVTGTAATPGVGTAGGAVAGMVSKKVLIKQIDDAVAAQVAKGVAKEVAEAQVKKEVVKRAAAAKLGSSVGIVESTAAMEGGGMWGEAAEEHGVENANAGSAFALGQVSGLSELYSPGGWLIQRLTGVKGTVSPVVDKVADTMLQRLGTEVPKSMGGEAAQEVFQSFLGVLNKKVQDPTVSLSDREAILEYINSGAAGAAGGVVFGGASAAFPEKPGAPAPTPKPAPTVPPTVPPAEEMPAEHTVDDVLDNHRAKVAVESAVAREQINKSGPVVSPDMTANTVGGVLGQAETTNQPAIIPQPAAEDISRLDRHIKEMATSLYPDPAKGDEKFDLPVWLKLKTLKDWEKETGEDIKSFVSSRSAKDTLKSVIEGKPLTERQSRVWGYLKSVAENKAMQGGKAAVGATSVPFDRGTGDFPADWGKTAQTSISEVSGEENTDSDTQHAFGGVQGNSPSLQAGTIPMEVLDGGQQPSDLQKDKGSRPQESGIDFEAGKEVEIVAPDPNEERFTDMVKILDKQESAEDVDALYYDMEPIFKARPDMAPYAEKWKAARDTAAARITGGEDAPNDQEVVSEDSRDVRQPGGEAGSQEPGVSSVNARPSQGIENSIPEAESIPNVERHEVIENPDSVAHTQEMNTAPSEAQIEAGNYKKAHIKLDGLDISVENPAGSTRSGTDKAGKTWKTEMKSDYGYIKGSVGYDKDHVDVFLAAGYQGGGETVYIVNQYDKDGNFDEHKVVFGAKSEDDAMDIYNANYEAGWTGGKSVAAMPIEQFKSWAKSEAPKAGPVSKTAKRFDYGDQANLASDAARELRGKSYPEKRNDDDVLLGSSDNYVLLKDAAELAKEAIASGVKPVPLQIAYSLDIAPGWGAKVLEAANALQSNQPVTTADAVSGEKEQSRSGDDQSQHDEIKSDRLPNIVDHTTKKGKIIKGIVRKDITLEQAKAIDKYTFPKDGGFFIREKYLSEEEKTGPAETATQEPTSAKIDGKSELETENQEAKESEKEPLKNIAIEPERKKGSTATTLFDKDGNRIPQVGKEKKRTVKKEESPNGNTNDRRGPGKQDNGDEPARPGSPEAGSEELVQGTKIPGADGPDNSSADIEADRTDLPGDQFAKNTVFTADAVAAARARLKAKRGTLAAGFDPELMQDLLVLGGAYFESGVRKFSEWSKTVLDDIGQEFKPFLRGTYENLRHWPGIDKDGMSDQKEVDAYLDGKDPQETDKSDKSADLEAANADLKKIDDEIEHLYQLRECLKA